jgi:hypothetical protein
MPHPQKEYAIGLRRDGKTYSEILLQVPVAKSTLTEWFKSVKLATPQKQRITQLRIDAQKKGAKARRNIRLKQVEELNCSGIKDVGKLTDRELWLIGTALHWAEGSKQKEHNPSTGVMFTNSDPKMLKLYLRWLKHLKVPMSSISFELYVHAVRSREVSAFKLWWSTQLRINVKQLDTVYLKMGAIKTNRKNVADLYHGLIRIKVRASTTLNRQVNGWIEGISA